MSTSFLITRATHVCHLSPSLRTLIDVNASARRARFESRPTVERYTVTVFAENLSHAAFLLLAAERPSEVK